MPSSYDSILYVDSFPSSQPVLQPRSQTLPDPLSSRFRPATPHNKEQIEAEIEAEVLEIMASVRPHPTSSLPSQVQQD
jgi:hypothetical protein